MLKTIRSKFIFTSVLFILISAGIPIYILISQFSENFNQRSRLMLNVSTNLLRYELYNAMMQGEKSVQSIISSLGKLESVDHIRIFNEQGRINYATEKSEVGKKLSDVAPKHVTLTNLDKASVRKFNEEQSYSLIEPIINEEKCQSCHDKTQNPIAYLDLDTDLTKAETVFFTGSSHMIFLGVVVIIILGVGLYFIFTYFINRPLTKLNTALQLVQRGNFEINIPEGKNDEIGKVYNRFNLMVNKLESSREEIEELHFEQLQRADRLTTLGELTAQVAHEVNNRTAVIMSRTDFLEMESSKQEKLKSYNEDFKTILDQTNKISEITKNLLRHSKQTHSQRKNINLEKVISQSILILQPLLKKKNIKCTFSTEATDSDIVGDELQIEQVITNLIINAADAVTNSGMIEVLLNENNNKLVVIIKDNGQGIKEEDINKIFSPFYTSKPQDKGTGLGLFIVQNICKSHGANIKCESDFGIGTSFQIDFVKAG